MHPWMINYLFESIDKREKAAATVVSIAQFRQALTKKSNLFFLFVNVNV